MTAPTHTGYQIRRAQGDLLLPAASRLAKASSGLDNAGEELLAAARLHAISFRYFWVSTDVDDPAKARQACLIVPGAGRTGMCFTTRPSTPEGEQELAAVIEQACSTLPPKVVRLAQALVETREEGLIRAHTLGGIPVLATLLYLRRPLPTKGEFDDLEPLPVGLEFVPYRPGRDEAEVMRVLPETYEGTLDCPELSSVRRPADVLASHRAAGVWTPDLWWLIRERGRAQGVALFNPIPDQDAIELVYYGLTPALRGRGLGKRLLQDVFARLIGRPERAITCACDERNAPALHIYHTLGMRESERRTALVRVIPERDA